MVETCSRGRQVVVVIRGHWLFPNAKRLDETFRRGYLLKFGEWRLVSDSQHDFGEESQPVPEMSRSTTIENVTP